MVIAKSEFWEWCDEQYTLQNFHLGVFEKDQLTMQRKMFQVHGDWGEVHGRQDFSLEGGRAWAYAPRRSLSDGLPQCAAATLGEGQSVPNYTLPKSQKSFFIVLKY